MVLLLREGEYRKGGEGADGAEGRGGERRVREDRKGGRGPPCVSLNFP